MRFHTTFNRPRCFITFPGMLLKAQFVSFNLNDSYDSFFRLSDSFKSLTLVWGWINWGRARWYTKWVFSKKEKTHLQPLVDMPKSSSRANRGKAQPWDRKPEMVCRSCLYHRPNYKQVSKHSFLLMVIINTRRKSNSCAISIIKRGIPWNTRLWAPATLYVKRTHRTSKTRLLQRNPVNHKPHYMHYSQTYDRKIWLKIFTQRQNTTDAVA